MNTALSTENFRQSYVENAFDEASGTYRLPCYFDGIERTAAWSLLAQAVIDYVAFPASHSTESAWLFEIGFESGAVWRISSKCTGIGGWDEMGSLSIDARSAPQAKSPLKWNKVDKLSFSVASADLLRYVSTVVEAESGLFLCDPCGRELVVVAAIPPGAVTLKIPGVIGNFCPEHDLTMYQRQRLQA